MRPVLHLLAPLLLSLPLTGLAAPEQPASERLQGDLFSDGRRLLLRPCGEQYGYPLLIDSTADPEGLIAEVIALSPLPLFVDVRGTLFSDAEGIPSLKLRTLYRLEYEGHGCADSGLASRLIGAQGNEPGWWVQVSARGLVFERQGEERMALPYLEEQLPDGGLSLSSEADGQQLELWLTPGLCQDSMSGALYHLRARLQIDGQPPLQGCASFGAARD